jgi:hypothetical protein
MGVARQAASQRETMFIADMVQCRSTGWNLLLVLSGKPPEGWVMEWAD